MIKQIPFFSNLFPSNSSNSSSSQSTSPSPAPLSPTNKSIKPKSTLLEKNSNNLKVKKPKRESIKLEETLQIDENGDISWVLSTFKKKSKDQEPVSPKSYSKDCLPTSNSSSSSNSSKSTKSSLFNLFHTSKSTSNSSELPTSSNNSRNSTPSSSSAFSSNPTKGIEFPDLELKRSHTLPPESTSTSTSNSINSTPSGKFSSDFILGNNGGRRLYSSTSTPERFLTELKEPSMGRRRESVVGGPIASFEDLKRSLDQIPISSNSGGGHSSKSSSIVGSPLNEVNNGSGSSYLTTPLSPARFKRGKSNGSSSSNSNNSTPSPSPSTPSSTLISRESSY